MEIYAAEGKKIARTVLSVIGLYLGIWYHIYQDNYYSAASTAELLLQNKCRGCGAVRESRGLLPYLKM